MTPQSTNRRIRVLVVEDEALLRFAAADDLRDRGFDVLEAANADEAIRILDADPSIGLLFTDIDMPGSMDGIKLSATVRDRWPPVRIIVTSGKQRPSPGLIPAGSKFVAKPYNSSALATTITEMMAG